MKKVLVLVLIISILFLSGCRKTELPFLDEIDQEFTMMYDDVVRKYYVYIPEGVQEQSPMLMMLHGYGGSIDSFVKSTDLKELAKRDQVILVYPEGTKALGLNHWNALLEYEDVDDIGFLSNLTTRLIEEYKVDENNVYVGGHSNGGFMAYTLACEQNNLFKAYMSVSGSMSNETWETCDIDTETNIFQFHGTDDFIVPIDGSMTELFGWGGAPKIEDMLVYWRDLLDNPVVTTKELSDEVEETIYQSSTDHKVVFIKATGYGHLWAKDNDLFDDEDEYSDISELLWSYMMSLIT